MPVYLPVKSIIRRWDRTCLFTLDSFDECILKVAREVGWLQQHEEESKNE